MRTFINLFLNVLLILLLSLPVNAQHEMGSEHKTQLLKGIGNLHHLVSTSNNEAQKFFDQGLTMIYGFNHAEAISSFKKATELDPHLAMAYWGIGYSFGPNYNIDADSDQKKQAYDAVKKAIALSKYASQKEKDYISALSKRYSVDPASDQKIKNSDFRLAMKELAAKYPDDLDAQTLYAESMMVLKPWQLWSLDGKPAEGTLEIVSVLEGVLKKDPNHIGANHYYIHAVEASDDPGRALKSAKIIAGLVPAAGHLVHMPAHIYFRVGDYNSASLTNIYAIKADDDYIKIAGKEGIYPLMYYNHNLAFLSVSKLMEGNFKSSIDAADKVAVNVFPFAKDMSMVESIVTSPLLVLVTFHKWKEILAYRENFSNLSIAQPFLFFAKGLAYARTGNVSSAKDELIKLNSSTKKLPADAVAGLNSAQSVLEVAEGMLEGIIYESEGRTEDAIAKLRSSVEKEDLLGYDEPPDWYPSVRWTLGGLLWRMKDFSGAEKIFREDLKKYPHNGRGLFGLYNSLNALDRTEEAKVFETEFNESWKNADVVLKMEEF